MAPREVRDDDGWRVWLFTALMAPCTLWAKLVGFLLGIEVESVGIVDEDDDLG